MKTFFKSSTNTNLDSTAASNFNLNNYQFQQISAANGASLLNKTNSTLHFNNNNNASLITNTKNNNPNFNSNNSN